MKVYSNIKDSKALQRNEELAEEARKKAKYDRMEHEFAGSTASEEKEVQNEAKAKTKKKRAKEDKA